MREGSGQLVIREVEDRDLGVLLEHSRDRDAIRMAAFTSPEADDRTNFERRWGAAEKRPLRASTWRVAARSPIGSTVKIGAAALPRVPYKSSCSWRQPVRFKLTLRVTTPRRFVC